METVKETNLSNFELAKLRELKVLPYVNLTISWAPWADKMDLYCPLGISRLVPARSKIICFSLTKLVWKLCFCVCLWTSTHLHDFGLIKIKITINDDDHKNNDTYNNILTSRNLNTSWLLLFLLIHCWITLTASTTSAFVKLSPPWFRITLRSLSWLNVACFNTVWYAGQDRF